MKVDKFRLFVFFIVGIVIVSWTLRSKRVYTLSGATMGTTYSVRAYTSLYIPKQILEYALEKELAFLSKEMSTYDPLSDISILNQQGKTKTGFRFQDVWRVSKYVNKMTQGAFNPTVKPLLEEWGVGTTSGFVFPEPSDIEKVLSTVGMDHFRLFDNGEMRALRTGVKLDFSAIAKGYGVDRLCEVLQQYGVKMAFVEIGGEVRVLGSKPLGNAWKLGLQEPTGDHDVLHGVVSLSEYAMATSGDYRQYFIHEGERYSHVLDPRTGYPVRHDVASVTVLAPTCVLADAFATGFMVMAPEDVIRLVESLEGLDVLILQRQSDNTFREYQSSGFQYDKISN